MQLDGQQAATDQLLRTINNLREALMSGQAERKPPRYERHPSAFYDMRATNRKNKAIARASHVIDEYSLSPTGATFTNPYPP